MSKVALSGNASGTGTFTIASPNGNTDRTLSLPDASGTILTTATPGVPVNGPAFSAYQNSGVSCSGATYTKLLFQVEEFDTNSNFASSRFTPTVEGYYQISAAFSMNGSGIERIIAINKNGSQYKTSGDGNVYQPGISCLVYMNGSTDYVEVYAYTGSTTTTNTGLAATWFQGALIRSAT